MNQYINRENYMFVSSEKGLWKPECQRFVFFASGSLKAGFLSLVSKCKSRNGFQAEWLQNIMSGMGNLYHNPDLLFNKKELISDISW